MPDSVAAGLRLAPEELTARSLPSNSPSTPPMTWSPSAACWARGVRSRRCSSVWRCRVRVTTYSSWASRGTRTLLLRQTLSTSRGQARRHALRLGLPEQFRRAARTSGDRAAAGQRNRIQRRHRPSDRQPDVDLPGGLRASGLPAEEERRRPRFQPALRPRPGLGGRRALEKDVALYRDSANVAFTPMKDGKEPSMRPNSPSCLRSRARAFSTKDIAALEEYLNEELASLPQWKRESSNQLREAQRGNHHPGPAACCRLWWRSTTTTRASAPTCRRCN